MKNWEKQNNEVVKKMNMKFQMDLGFLMKITKKRKNNL